MIFSGPRLSLKRAAETKLTRAYAALGRLEKTCAQIQFHEPRTKLWLFDTLVTSAMLYGVEVWDPSLNPRNPNGNTNGWQHLERPLVSMISWMIRAKKSVPHDIIRAEMGTPPMEVEALTKTVCFLHKAWELPRNRYTRLALESSQQLALQGDTSCWYAQMMTWFQQHDFSMGRLPPFQYALDAPSPHLKREEISRLVR